MRFIEIKLCNLPKTLTLFSFAFLLLCYAISVKQISAQDIPNTEEIKAVIAAPQRKRAANAVKPKEVKPKITAASLKNISSASKSKPKAANKEKYAAILVNEDVSKANAIAAVSGSVRLKQ